VGEPVESEEPGVESGGKHEEEGGLRRSLIGGGVETSENVGEASRVAGDLRVRPWRATGAGVVNVAAGFVVLDEMRNESPTIPETVDHDILRAGPSGFAETEHGRFSRVDPGVL
jgi:hypothetical protein